MMKGKELVERDWINLFDSIEPLDKTLSQMNKSKAYYEANKEEILKKMRRTKLKEKK